MASLLPRISIVTPSFQQGQYLAQTIESVITQGYPDLEYIVIDGGSTDGSVDVAMKYAEHLTYFASESDFGQAHAIQKGFKRASGSVLAWLNSDDTYEPGVLLQVGEFLSRHPEVGLLYGNYNVMDESGNVLERKKQPTFDLGIAKYAYMTIPQQAAFWRADLYRAVGGINEEFRFAMDYDLFLRLAEKTRVRHVAVPFGNFRLHRDSKTTTSQSVNRQEIDAIRRTYCEVKPDTLLFKWVSGYHKFRLIVRCVKEGCLGEKVINRIRRYLRVIELRLSRVGDRAC